MPIQNICSAIWRTAFVVNCGYILHLILEGSFIVVTFGMCFVVMVTMKVYEGYVCCDTTCKLIVRDRRPCVLWCPHFSLLTSCSRSLRSDIITVPVQAHTAYHILE